LQSAQVRFSSQHTVSIERHHFQHLQSYISVFAAERKVLWRQKELRLRLFDDVYALLLKDPNHRIDRDLVLETMVLNMPQENYEKMFETFIRWARFGELFNYDEHTRMISLD
jgi:hypothetical protein